MRLSRVVKNTEQKNKKRNRKNARHSFCSLFQGNFLCLQTTKNESVLVWCVLLNFGRERSRIGESQPEDSFFQLRRYYAFNKADVNKFHFFGILGKIQVSLKSTICFATNTHLLLDKVFGRDGRTFFHITAKM